MGRPALLFALAGLVQGCADMPTVVRAQAARDLGCTKERVVILDGDLGIYRLRACGLEASYFCRDGAVLGTVDCERLEFDVPPAKGVPPAPEPFMEEAIDAPEADAASSTAADEVSVDAGGGDAALRDAAAASDAGQAP